jgi:thioredoxin-like negative regulator of GroEL
MAPIVHGLEQQYDTRVDFLYLDVQDGQTATAKTRLGFVATPHFFLLHADGRILREWQGVIPADTLESGLRRLIGEDS